MRKFDSWATKKEQTTKSSAVTERYSNKQGRSVTPFDCHGRSRSPHQRRIEQSPLQIPLALAISKLVVGQARAESDLYDKKISFTELLNESKNQSQISAYQLQNIKNILQEFMQSLFNNMQREITQKFNVQMRRMILKYRQADTIIRKMQQMVVANADIIELQEKFRIKAEMHQRKYGSFVIEIQHLNGLLEHQRRENRKKETEIVALKEQIQRVTLNLQKYQNAIFRKLQEINRGQHNNLGYTSHRHTNEHYYSSLPINHYTQNITYSNIYTDHNKQNLNQSNLQNSSLTSSPIQNINHLNPSRSPFRGNKNRRSHKPTFPTKKPYENSYRLIKKDIGC